MAAAFSDPAHLALFDALAALLAQLAAGDNAVRAAAEEQLNAHWLANQAPALIAGLAHLVAAAPTPDTRSFAAVLLRRIATRSPDSAPAAAAAAAASAEAKADSYYVSAGDDVRAFVQSRLLHSLAAELQLTVRTKVCDTVAELAYHMLEQGTTWPELITSVAQFAQSPEARHRQSAFLIMSGVSGLFVGESLETVQSILASGIQDADPSVRFAAIRAACYYLIDLDAEANSSPAGLVPLMLGALSQSFGDSSLEDSAKEALGHLIELAEEAPKLFKSNLPQIIEFMTTMMKNSELDDSTRHTCLELLLTLAEALPGMMRRQASFCHSVIPIMLEWMTEHEEDEEWYQTEDLDDNDQEANETVGEQSMDRIARNMGGKIVLPISFNLIPSYLAAPEWQRRHAALRCISAIGEGCHKIMSAELGKVVSIVLPHLRDPHPRVRHAACNAIGQMCTDFAPKIQEKFHEEIVSHLVFVIEDTQRLRVQTYAAAALVNFSEGAAVEHIAPYLGAIIPKLTLLLNTGKVYAQEQAITTLATVADSSGPKFSEFYPIIMPVLMDFLRNATGKELRALRGKTLECATLIAMAVGKDIFAPNASEFIQLMQTIQGSITDSDDPQSSYLLSGWARICKVLGQDFAPFMGYVLPPLFKSAQIKPDVAVFDEADPEEAEEWEMLTVNGQRVGIRTSILDEKCTAIEMLLCYARELGPLFHQYVQDTMNLVVPLLEFYFHDGVRFAAAAVIPLLFQSWAKASYPRDQVLTLWQEVAGKLLQNINGETDIELVSQLYTTFEESIKIVGPQSLNPQLLESFIKQTQEQLKEYVSRHAERQKTRNDPDYDPEDEQTLQEDEQIEDAFLDSVARAGHAVFASYGTAFLPYFNELVPLLDNFINSSDVHSRRLALSLYQDLIEFAPVESVQYQPRFLERFLAAILDRDASVRQTAAYGIGMAAKTGGNLYQSVCVSALQSLFAIVKDPEARSDDNILATENAIAAIGRICRAYGPTGGVDLNQVLPHWFAALPIIEDEDEIPETYTYLLELVEANHPALSLSDPTNLFKLVDILTQVLAIPVDASKDAQADMALTQHMLALLRKMLSQCDETTRGSLWQRLPQDRRKMLASKGYF